MFDHLHHLRPFQAKHKHHKEQNQKEFFRQIETTIYKLETCENHLNVRKHTDLWQREEWTTCRLKRCRLHSPVRAISISWKLFWNTFSVNTSILTFWSILLLPLAIMVMAHIHGNKEMYFMKAQKINSFHFVSRKTSNDWRH